jgi:uncharacterized protein YndB with AHSA1/START domain
MADRHPAIRVTRCFSAPPERVFDAWLDPGVAGKWLFATASRPMARVKIDARVEGSFCFVDRQDGDEVEHTGEYIEIVRPRRLAFTLAVGSNPKVITRVIVGITPLKERAMGGTGGAGRLHAPQVEGARTLRSSMGGSMGCELTLVHENVPPEHASRTETRWTGVLYGLAMTLQAGLSDRYPNDRDSRRNSLSISGPAERL